MLSQIDGVYYCLSADTPKPSGDLTNGTCLIEMDTSKVYFYDKENETWVEFGGGS